MSKWEGKFVIGLTGNIGTGKSVVRRMLEHLGAYGIDADALAHRAIAKDAPGYHQVIEQFGSWMLDAQGNIDRSKLGGFAFSTPEALAQLENIIHPIVIGAVDTIIQHAHQSIIAIEAIKLLEAGMDENCDSLWVTYTSTKLQLGRLMESRDMSEQEAHLRISGQPPQEDKLARAQIIINNLSTFKDTWNQVLDAWNKNVPIEAKHNALSEKVIAEDNSHHLALVRADPRQIIEITRLLNRANPGKPMMNQGKVMQMLSQSLFLLIYAEKRCLGAVSWQPDNMIARITNIYLDPDVAMDTILPFFISNIDHIANQYQCEAVLVSLPGDNNGIHVLFSSAGYKLYHQSKISNEIWAEAARESFFEGSSLYIKPHLLEPVINQF